MKTQETPTETIPVEETTIQTWIDKVNRIDQIILKDYAIIKKNGWNQQTDLRMNLLKNLIEINMQTILRFSYNAESIYKLNETNWLIERLPHHKDAILKLPDYKIFCQNIMNSSLNEIKTDFLLKYFFEIEAKLRLIFKNIPSKIPRECTKNAKKKRYVRGTEHFHEIYLGLLKTYLHLPKKDYEVLSLTSTIRNTIHNSGFYYNRMGINKSITYRNSKYSFTHSKPINFLSDDLIEQIVSDIISLIVKVLSHGKIIQIKFMEDPITKITFLNQ